MRTYRQLFGVTEFRALFGTPDARPADLFAATAAGMLTGDIMVGRFLPAQARTWLVEPLRFLLAVPYVLFFLHPALAPAAVLGFLASAGTRPACRCKSG